MEVSGTSYKDYFLKLLTTQLQYQNPLNPMEGTEFTAQLAQFSTLEQLQDISSQMREMVMSQNSMQAALTTGMIGKRVKVKGEDVYLKDKAEIYYKLPQDAAKVKISIFDSTGKLVREVETTNQASGSRSFIWDGKDSNGNALPEGNYKFKVEAFNASGSPIEAAPLSGGTVTGVSFENNNIYLVLDGNRKILLSEVMEIINGG
jgi:flagellar basal-body rod modification protein FlgD